MCSIENFPLSTGVSTFTSVTCARSLGPTRTAWKEFAVSGASGICTPGQLKGAGVQCFSIVTARLLWRLIVDGVIDAGILHLVPGLFPPMNLFCGIGIRLVIDRVVVMRNGLQLRAFRDSK